MEWTFFVGVHLDSKFNFVLVGGFGGDMRTNPLNSGLDIFGEYEHLFSSKVNT
jgi:hypothetical protein